MSSSAMPEERPPADESLSGAEPAISHEQLFALWPEPVFVLDARLGILSCNPAAAGLNPRPECAPAGSAFGDWLQAGHEALSESLSASRVEDESEPKAEAEPGFLLTFRGLSAGYEARLLRTPWAGAPYLLACRPLPPAQEELRRQIEQLSRSNRDLERFAYVASHDLQEPLRMVSSFLQLLKRRYAPQLDESANQYIHFAVDGAERMKQLIEDLLTYSRTANHSEALAPTSLQDCLEQALKLLRIQIDESAASIRSAPLPEVLGNSTLLVQLFQNLIGNALKYRHPDRAPELDIGVRQSERFWDVYIQDNGIGIEPAFFEQIFVIFKRLHSKSDYSGTGIGLALCKKIVESQGGRIWVESEPERGSCFWFSLPIAEPAIQGDLP